MKSTRHIGSLERQFPHLRNERPNKTGTLTPALALVATGAIVVLGATLIPVADTARDFRKETRPVEAATDPYQPMRWADLIPAGWSASTEIRKIQEQHRGVVDADPRARASLGKIREVLDAAPTEPLLDGRRIRIPGYVVPLGGLSGGALEFLLVPYFGACIHTPPPPSNQTIHVNLSEPFKKLAAMDAVWVRGTLTVERNESAGAVSGYRLTDASVEPYKPSTGK